MQSDSTIQWNRYPALLLSGCLAGGIQAAACLPGIPFRMWAAWGAVGMALCLLSFRLAHRRLVSPLPLFRTVGLGIIVVAGGGASYALHGLLPASHIGHRMQHIHPQEMVLMTGRVTGDPVPLASGTRFTLSLHRIVAGRDTFRTSGRVQVTLSPSRWEQTRPFPAVQHGTVLQLEGRLRPLPTPRNPADFDYGRYLRRRGIYARCSLYNGAAVTVLGYELQGLEEIIVPLRTYVRRQLSALLPSREGRSVLTALILGDRRSLDPEARDHFARTGLMHLLAVSGLHIFLVGMALYELLRPMLIRLRMTWSRMERVRAAVTMLLLLLYMLLTGASASAVRAVIMAGLFIGGILLQRTAHPLNTLGVAAVVLLLLRPAQLFDIGFQLSFAAVAALLTLMPVLGRLLPSSWARGSLRQIPALLLTSVAATLGTMPVLLYHFGRVSFAGLLLNLVAIPCTLLTLTGGLAAVVLGGWAQSAARPFGAAADILARTLLSTAEVGDRLFSWAALEAYVEDVCAIAAMVALLVMLAQWPRPRLRWRLLAAALLFAGIGLWTHVLGGTARPYLEVLFFDVGQGDAALVTFPNGRRLLIDTGDGDAFADQGTRTILPHLARRGIRRLDAVLITHPHRDHMGGLPALLHGIPIHRIIHNGENYSSTLYAQTMHLLDSLGIDDKRVRAGDTLLFDPSVRIQVLSPVPASGPAEEPNNASVVLRVAYGETVLLFTGDAEREAEQQMLLHYRPLLASNVVKVGHHGSATSSSPRFVDSILPDSGTASMAVVSVGRQNRFGLPDAEVLARWKRRGAAIHLTAAEGAVWIRSDGTRIEQVRWR